MKKLLILSNVVTLATLIFFGCTNDNEGNSTLATANKVAGAANCYAPASSGTEFGGLNAMLMYKLVKNYRNKQLAAINSSYYPGAIDTPATESDARSVWFDMETIKRFIYEVESQTCAKCGSPSKTLGIRIYYGTYPDASAWRDTLWTNALGPLPESYAGKHTIMMVPTYHDDKTNAEIDFDPKYVTSGCDFTNLETFYANMQKNPPANIVLTALAGISGTAQNHGEMVPPPFDNQQILSRGAGIMYAADQY